MSRLYVSRYNDQQISISRFERLDSIDKIIYKCGKCGAEFPATELEYLPSIKCPYCGYRVVYKARPPGVKIVYAI